ncbi:hypothetical protein [Rhodococcus aerolatus]
MSTPDGTGREDGTTGGTGPGDAATPDTATSYTATSDTVPDEGSDLLARATAELRQAPEKEPTWQDVSESVVTALRSVTRRSTWVTAGLGPRPRAAGGTAAGVTDTVALSDEGLAVLVRRALAPVAGGAPSALDVHVDDAGRCTGLDVDVVAAYGQDLRGLVAEVRDRCAAVLRDVLGDDAAPPVAVQVVDVTEGDPRA